MRLIGSPLDVGESQDGPMPPDDADFTWHVHDPKGDGYSEKLWGTGVACDWCVRPPKKHGGGKTVHWNVGRLKYQNEIGQSALEMEREIIDTAKAEGREDKIDRLR